MTISSSKTPAGSDAAGAPRAREPWATPTLARIDSADAENSANPAAPDGIPFGS
jgi:hypothetical protein